jgi:hypothetical protein
MSNYSVTTNFGAKDNLTTGDTNKIVRGSELTTEFAAIATAVNSKADDSGLGKLAVESTWTAQQIPMNGVLTPGATVNWNADTDGQIVSLTLDQNTTMAAPSNINQNACYVIRITNGGSAYTVTWNAAYKFPGGVDHVMTATAAAVDIITFVGGAGNSLYCVGQAKALA